MISAIPNFPASRPRPGPVGRWYVFFTALHEMSMTDHRSRYLPTMALICIGSSLETLILHANGDD